MRDLGIPTGQRKLHLTRYDGRSSLPIAEFRRQASRSPARMLGKM